MKKTTKKCLAAMMTVIMLCASVFVPGIGNMGNVQAEEVEQEFVIEDDVLVRYDGNEEEVVIPEGVTTIGGWAFEGNATMKKVTIPDGVTTINISAFERCTNLTSIVIPDGVTCIDERAFYGCEKLESITVPTSVTELGSNVFTDTLWLDNEYEKGPLVILNQFVISGKGCYGDVVIPDGVTEIVNSAFSNSWITSIVIPEGVTRIGHYAFGNCLDLSNITFPESLNSVGWSAFYDTPWLENERIKDPIVVVNDVLVDGRTCSGAAVVPEHVTSIADEAFYECKNLTSIEISENVKYIGESAFENCYNLVSIVSPSGVTCLGDRAFYKCRKLETYDIADGVTKIPMHAFYGCKSLKSVTMADSVEEVWTEAFSGCTSLEDITFSKNLTTFKYDAFAKTKWLENARSKDPLVIVNNVLVDGETCTKLDIVIPDGVIAIAENGFADNSRFFNLTIPASVTEIGENAFLGANMFRRILGYAGSYAETYAKENGYEFAIIEDVEIPSESPNASSKPVDTSGPGVLPSTNPEVSTKPGETESADPGASSKPGETESANPGASTKPDETPSEPVKDVKYYDVDGKEGIVLLDAQMILKYALKITKSDVPYTLKDAQTCLKIALKIITLK